ncbi:serine acetyltransferase [Motilibacter deserti]|uniref:Serine acetyltransferase n=1 Tax=Motilibacter deserti TaxID=2714956 RepID=A0ABX0GSG2_9ACTN|nr:serine acetyltransferase [Motilibacter deserti]NHC13435.1 serine acetyltransferase [Motilibacter deserti]
MARPGDGSVDTEAGNPQLRDARYCWQKDRERYGAKPFFREQSIWAVAVFRWGQWGDQHPRKLVRLTCDRVYWPVYRLVETLTGITLDKTTEVGAGLRIYHFGGIVVHPKARLGQHVTLRQGTTIGERKTGAGAPRIGDSVEIGAHALVLGDISVGDGARVGAGALVIRDVAPGGVALGIESRILPGS